jgi:hypothetical protein
VTGVCWNKHRGKWRAYITVNQKQISLGSFTEKEDAMKARKNAELKYFWQNRGDK